MDADICSSRDYYTALTPEKTPVWIEESKCLSLPASRKNTPLNLSFAESNSHLRRAIDSAIETMSTDASSSWTALDGSLEPAYSPLLDSSIQTPVDLGFIPMTAEPTPLMGLSNYSLQDSSRLAQSLGLRLQTITTDKDEDEKEKQLESKDLPVQQGSLNFNLPDAVQQGGTIIFPAPLGYQQWAPSWPGVGYLPRAESPTRQMQNGGGPVYSENMNAAYGEDMRNLSIGSQGHPVSCGPACKYAWKSRGCKEGLQCARCHLCLWTRASMRLARQQQ